MRLLIIGGSGFLSGTLARVARDAGHAVWTVTRGERPAPTGVTALTADRKDDAAFRAALGKAAVTWDLAVDCIGYHASDVEQDIAALAGRAAHFVFVSTDFVFDPQRRELPQPEEGVYLTGDTYGARKRQCEQLLLDTSPDTLPWTVVRPCHIYGPGSELGCLPCHSRDPGLLDALRRGAPLRLVGGGHFLQQPILAEDLAHTILSCAENEACRRQVVLTPGPEIIESRTYYQVIADVLGVTLTVEEVPVATYLREHPEHAPFLCHRIYRPEKLEALGLHRPATGVRAALEQHVRAVVERPPGPR
jgi:nucleoside-diphosphate-sugar epimerase